VHQGPKNAACEEHKASSDRAQKRSRINPTQHTIVQSDKDEKAERARACAERAMSKVSEPLPINVPRRIKEEPGTDTASSDGTTELASSFASSSTRHASGAPLYPRPSNSTSELQSSGSPRTSLSGSSYPARAASMGHAADVKRGLALNRQRQAQARQQRAASGRVMKRTHSVCFFLSYVWGSPSVEGVQLPASAAIVHACYDLMKHARASPTQ